MGLLGVRLAGGGGGAAKLAPVKNSVELCWKLEIWYKRLHKYVVSENIRFDSKTPFTLANSSITDVLEIF